MRTCNKALYLLMHWHKTRPSCLLVVASKLHIKLNPQNVFQILYLAKSKHQYSKHDCSEKLTQCQFGSRNHLYTQEMIFPLKLFLKQNHPTVPQYPFLQFVGTSCSGKLCHMPSDLVSSLVLCLILVSLWVEIFHSLIFPHFYQNFWCWQTAEYKACQ